MPFFVAFLVLFGFMVLAALEVARRASSGRRLERSLDALRSLGDEIELSSMQQVAHQWSHRTTPTVAPALRYVDARPVRRPRAVDPVPSSVIRRSA